jgi:hypothetical protein
MGDLPREIETTRIAAPQKEEKPEFTVPRPDRPAKDTKFIDLRNVPELSLNARKGGC